METSNTEDDVFKKPSFLPEKASGKPPPAEKSDPEPKEESVHEKRPPEPEPVPPNKPTAVKPCTPIPYTEPSWGGRPDVLYSLEEMKTGVSLRTITLDQRSFYCFGRMDNCHVAMAHPTISRYHAVLQYRSTFSETDEKRGFYLYDLGSTHGTFLNKHRIIPKTYVKVQVGHMLKFGSSTRFFLLHGPDEDQEEESNYSYSELKDLRNKELERRQAAYLEDQAKIQKICEEREKEEEARGIDWGMGEDADEETDLTENPFAMTTNEELYADDPKKTLRGWFEREGEELHYKVEEKGFGKFYCSIELPIETSTGTGTVAEATVSGKKKEAVHQCALEACRMLDRAGLLKQGNQESRKRKLKNWEEDDYYDSDEDSFFDRTGDLEVKRKQRMNQIKKTQAAADTYETLIEKHKNVLNEIENIENKLQNTLAQSNSNTEDEDTLDSYMSQITGNQVVDKLEARKYKNLLTGLKTDEERLRKLIAFVKPIELPQYKPLPITEEKIETNVRTKDKRKIEQPEGDIPQSDTTQSKESETEVSESSKAKPKFPSNSDEFVSPAMLKRKLKEASRPPPSTKEGAKSFQNQFQEDFSNLEWTPPVNQTGDGRTSLNDKYGY